MKFTITQHDCCDNSYIISGPDRIRDTYTLRAADAATLTSVRPPGPFWKGEAGRGMAISGRALHINVS